MYKGCTREQHALTTLSTRLLHAPGKGGTEDSLHDSPGFPPPQSRFPWPSPFGNLRAWRSIHSESF